MATAEAVRCAKAYRLIEACQVRIREVIAGRILAEVTGGTGRHVARRSQAGRWSCSCQAGWFGNRCPHAETVALVTDPDN